MRKVRGFLIIFSFFLILGYQNCGDINVVSTDEISSCAAIGGCNPNTNHTFYEIEVIPQPDPTNGGCRYSVQTYNTDTEQTQSFELPQIAAGGCDILTAFLKTDSELKKRVVVTTYLGIDGNEEPVGPFRTFIFDIDFQNQSVTVVNNNFLLTQNPGEDLLHRPENQRLVSGAPKGHCNNDSQEDFYIQTFVTTSGFTVPRQMITCISGSNLSSLFRSISNPYSEEYRAFASIEDLDGRVLNGGTSNEALFRSQTTSEFSLVRGAGVTLFSSFDLDVETVRFFKTIPDLNSDNLKEFIGWSLDGSVYQLSFFRSDNTGSAPSYNLAYTQEFNVNGFTGPFFGRFSDISEIQVLSKNSQNDYEVRPIGVGAITTASIILSNDELETLLPEMSLNRILYTLVVGDLNNDGFDELAFESRENLDMPNQFRARAVIDVKNKKVEYAYRSNHLNTHGQGRFIFGVPRD